jgi:D-aminoacyl-tRNA deacylase
VRLVLQRVSRAEVRVGATAVASIGPGLLILAGSGVGEDPGDPDRLAAKVAVIRIFADAAGKMNRSILDTGGQALVVPQFTLHADTARGRRPSWVRAAPPEVARERVEAFARALEGHGVTVRRGAFQEHMEVELVNDGPVTIILEGSGGS